MIEGMEIEKESFRIIDEKLEGFEYPESHVVRRVIHATADFQFAELIQFHNDPIKAAIVAIRNGKNIITDVNMVKVGISRSMEKFGGRTMCHIDSKDTIEYAVEKNITRARAAFRLHRDSFHGNIVAIGNAPTSLFELCKLMDEGIMPAMVIGVPVGFVGARESKEELLKYPVPSIAIKGNKGGSSIAAAIANSLINLVEQYEE